MILDNFSIMSCDMRNKMNIQVISYIKMFFLSAIVIMSAWFIACCFNKNLPLSISWINSFEYLGYICWGTALAESKVDSWSKCTPPEKLYRKLQIFCSEIGIFFFVLAKTLESAS
jgi:hypothetical protein